MARSIDFQPPCSKTVSRVPGLSPWMASWGEYIFIVYLLYPHGAAPFYFPFRSSPHCTCVVFCLGQILVALFFPISRPRICLPEEGAAGPVQRGRPKSFDLLPALPHPPRIKAEAEGRRFRVSSRRSPYYRAPPAFYEIYLPILLGSMFSHLP